MTRTLRVLSMLVAIGGSAAIGGSSLAQPKGNKDRKEDKDPKGKREGGDKQAKGHKHENGKEVVGDKIKKDGHHEFQKHGKDTAFVDIKGGKIAGITVKHSEKGDVPVKKYNSSQKMAGIETFGDAPASFPVQMESIGTLWIGYAYIDDYGEEIIYWFPYDMVLDGETGAVEYYAMY